MQCTDMSPEDRERFWAKVAKQPSGCWMWTGVQDRRRCLGLFKYDKKRKYGYVHRIAYEMEHGPLAPNSPLVPLCGKTLCVNPDHRVTRLNDAFIEARFWERVEKTDSCWIWKGGRDKDGYGMFWFSGTTNRAHQFAYVIQHGPIPAGKLVLHHCDNPPCVRGDHLYVGTNAENVRDKVTRGRTTTGDTNGSRLHPERLRRGGTHPHALATDAEVLEMKRQFAEGISYSEIAAHAGRPVPYVRDAVSRSWHHLDSEAGLRSSA